MDINGLPVHLALTPGEAHDNRRCSALLSALLPQTSSVGVSRPDTTNSRPTIWHSSSSHQSAFGCALISPRP